MWRVGTAAILLLLLIVLVADMLFGPGPAPPQRASGDLAYSQGTMSPGTLVGQPLTLPSVARDSGTRGERPEAPTGSEATAPAVAGSLDGTAVAALDASALDRLPVAPRDVHLETWPGYPPVGYIPDAGDIKTPAPAMPAEEPPALHSPPPPAQRPPRVDKPKAVYDPKLSEVQRKLAALGYSPGPADGFLGKRTDAAIRAFQKDKGLPADGKVEERLVARLTSEVARGAQLRQQELEAMGPEEPPKVEKPPKDRGMLGAVLGGFQRLLGRDFNSVQRPDELASYCRSNTDTWIYDFGKEAFVYCGNIVAGASRSAAAAAGEAGGTSR